MSKQADKVLIKILSERGLGSMNVEASDEALSRVRKWGK